MEIGKLFATLAIILVSIIAIYVYISIYWQLTEKKCNENLVGSSDYILSSLKDCVETCWSKNEYGKREYNQDCYTVNLNSSEILKKERIESFLNSSIKVKVYFDFLKKNTNYKIKVRYNYTGQEISLLIGGIQ